MEKRDGRVAAVTFDRGSIPVDGFDTFRFIAKNPVREGTIAWDVRQSYRGGEVVDWAGPPDSDTPAARTRIAEASAPVDVVDVNGGEAVAVAAGAAAASGGGGHDGLALVLAAAGLCLGGLALAIALLRGRPLA